MTSETTAQLANPAPESRRRGRLLSIARVVAMLFMAFCIITFVWGLLLFPRYGLANLDAIRPNDAWSDTTLLAVIADADLPVARLGYAKLAVGVLAAAILVAVGLVIFWRKADSWFGLYVGVLFVWFGTQANSITAPVGQVQPLLAPIDDIRGIWCGWLSSLCCTCSPTDALCRAGRAGCCRFGLA